MKKKILLLLSFIFLIIACALPGMSQAEPTIPPFLQIVPTETTGTPLSQPLTPEVPTIVSTTGITDPTPTTALPPTIGHIVFSCFMENNDDVCIMDGDGSNQKQLTHSPATDYYASLSPDGKTIVFSSNRTDKFEIYSMNTDGTNVVQLTDQIGEAAAPAFSPDGKSIVFTNKSEGYQHIWIMDRKGRNQQPLTSGKYNDIDASWSPDGKAILFTSDRNGDNQLFILSMDGGDAHEVNTFGVIPNGRNDWSPDWAPLAFYAGKLEDQSRNIYLINPSGNNLRKITDKGDNLAPSFSPDGQWIAFTSYRTGTNEIFIMSLDGSNVRQLTFAPYSCWQPRWGH